MYRVVQSTMALRQAERAELVLHAVTVRLVDGAALAVAHVPGELVAGLLHREPPVHLPAAGVVHRVDHGQQVQGLGDPPVLGERLPQRGGRPSRPNIRSRS
jgi:hypothetical protein